MLCKIQEVVGNMYKVFEINKWPMQQRGIISNQSYLHQREREREQIIIVTEEESFIKGENFVSREGNILLFIKFYGILSCKWMVLARCVYFLDFLDS